jgi:hypothetical protein
MIARHLLMHVGVAAGVVALLATFGVPVASALPIGVMAGCVAMVLGMGHGHSQHRSTPEQRDERGVRN